MDQKVVRPTHFQTRTIIITLDLVPTESHHRTSSSALFRTVLMSYVWVAMFNQFWTRIFIFVLSSIGYTSTLYNVNVMQLWAKCPDLIIGIRPPSQIFFLYSPSWRTFSADFRLAAFFPADFRPAIFCQRIRLKFSG